MNTAMINNLSKEELEQFTQQLINNERMDEVTRSTFERWLELFQSEQVEQIARRKDRLENFIAEKGLVCLN